MEHIYKTQEEMLELVKQGYRKVSHDGGSLVTGEFYNPENRDVTYNTVLADYDYGDASRDCVPLYEMPIDEDVRKLWAHRQGWISVGDKVEVFKGRKVAIGTVATVESIRPYYDQYHRLKAYYCYFTDGQRTNIDNCRLVWQE